MPSCEAVREMRRAISPRLAIITEVMGVMATEEEEEEEEGLLVERRAREGWDGRRGRCRWARLRDLMVLVDAGLVYSRRFKAQIQITETKAQTHEATQQDASVL